jgi:hypothetical protein
MVFCLIAASGFAWMARQQRIRRAPTPEAAD